MDFSATATQTTAVRCIFSACRGRRVSIQELAQDLGSTALSPSGKSRCCSLQLQSVIKRRFANTFSVAHSTVPPRHLQRVQRAFSLSGPMERNERVSESLSYVEPNPQTRCNDEPMISICSFFCRKRHLLVPSAVTFTPQPFLTGFPFIMPRILHVTCF